MRGTDKAATRSYVSAGALNSTIKTPAHVYYFILVPEPPRLKRIHNYRRLREPLNLSRAPARTNVIYACVDFNSHAARRIVAVYDRTPAYAYIVCNVYTYIHTYIIYIYIYIYIYLYIYPRGPRKNYPRPVATDSRYVCPTRIQISRVGFRAPTRKRNRAAAHKSRAFHRTDMRSIASYVVIYFCIVFLVR